MKHIHDAILPGNVYFRNRTFEPSDIAAGIGQIAGFLNDSLISESPFVYLFASNNIKTLFALFGISKAGRIAVVIDPRIGRIELSEICNDTPPSAFIRIDDSTTGWDFGREIEICSPESGFSAADDIDDVCILMYTAADDGRAKAAMLTHENLLADAYAIASGNNVGPGTVSMAVLPLSHGFGLQTGIITPLISGGDLVIAENDDAVNIRSAHQMLYERHVTHLYSIPAFFYLLCKIMRHQGRLTDLSSLISGGYALPGKIYETTLDVCGLPVRQGYGLTEASPVCSWLFTEKNAGPGSIGRPIACCEMKIKQGVDLPAGCGSIGEILVKGKNVMKGYYRHSEVNRRILQDGWLHTGDAGYQDVNGYFNLVTTRKRMINHSGMKVYPAEVERLLLMNESVDRVLLYGIKDAIGGEKVGCTMQLKHDTAQHQEAIRRWMMDQLSGFKIPRNIDFADEIKMCEVVAQYRSNEETMKSAA